MLLTEPGCDMAGPVVWISLQKQHAVTTADAAEWAAALRGFQRRGAHCRQLDADLSASGQAAHAQGLLAAAAASAPKLASLVLGVQPGSRQEARTVMQVGPWGTSRC